MFGRCAWAIAPAGSVIVAEIHVADGDASQRVFFLGANRAGETAPG